jgi:hypothetical protein
VLDKRSLKNIIKSEGGVDMKEFEKWLKKKKLKGYTLREVNGVYSIRYKGFALRSEDLKYLKYRFKEWLDGQV